MIPKKNRVHKALFDLIYTTGSPVHSPLFYLLYINNSNSIQKFSFVVSKKIAKSAVIRNKLRRRGYSIIRKYNDFFNKNIQCVIFLKFGAQKLTFKEYEEQIVFLFKKAKILLQ